MFVITLFSMSFCVNRGEMDEKVYFEFQTQEPI